MNRVKWAIHSRRSGPASNSRHSLSSNKSAVGRCLLSTQSRKKTSGVSVPTLSSTAHPVVIRRQYIQTLMPESPLSSNRNPAVITAAVPSAFPSPSSFSSTIRQEEPPQQVDGRRSIMRRVRSWSSLNRGEGEDDDDDDGCRVIVRDAEQQLHHHIKDKQQQQAAGGATRNRDGGGEEGVTAASKKAGFLYWRQVARILIRWLEWRREVRQQQRELCRKFFDECSPRTMSSDDEEEEEAILEHADASSRSWSQRGRGRGRQHHDSHHQPVGSARPRQQREWRDDGGGASSSSTEVRGKWRWTMVAG
jgi:hypothetical protein